MADNPPQDRPPEMGARPKAMRPPNKKKFEEGQDSILENIRTKEAELKSLGKPSKESSPEGIEERNQLNAQFKSLRAEKFKTIERRKEKEQMLQTIRSEITKKGDVLSKLEASLPYRTTEGLNKALKNLDYQLQHKKLTPREESRLVREIETLKRSKSKVREYNQKKQEIEEDKDKRKKMKEEKDKDFNHVSELKNQEEQIKQRLGAMKKKEDDAWARYREGGERRDHLKTEIDALYEKRRRLTASHKLDQEKYKQYTKEYREGERKRIEETRKARAAERLKQKREYDEPRDPHIEERQTCAALIKYLQSYIPHDEETSLNTAAKVRHSTESLNLSDLPESDYTILRRKGDSDDDIFGPPSTGRRKKGRRQRRQSGHSKTLRHSHQIFLQFLSLKVDAPPTMTEVVETLVKLRSKLEYLEKLVNDEKQPSDLGSSHGSDLTLSDYSYEQLQDHELLEVEEDDPHGGEPQSLPSDTSKDDGIHSLSSSSTVNDCETSTDKLGGFNETLKSGEILNVEDTVGIREGEASDEGTENQTGKMDISNENCVTSSVIIENIINNGKDNGFNEDEIIPKDSEDGVRLGSEIPVVGKSIDSLGGELTADIINGQVNSNNSNISDTPSKNEAVEYLRTLSDTLNQNDIVAVNQS